MPQATAGFSFARDPAQAALDQARLDAIIDFVPADVARRCILQTRSRFWRNAAREAMRHPLETAGYAVRSLRELPGWALSTIVWRAHPLFRHQREPGPLGIDVVRREVARAWFYAIHLHHDLYHRGEPCVLDGDMLPPLPRDRSTFSEHCSWPAHFVRQCEQRIDEVAAQELIAAFVSRVKATIDTQGALDLPAGIFIRKDPAKYGGYLAERRSA